MNLIGVAEDALGQFRSAQLRNLYRRDFIAWQADVLGLRTYKKMRDIAETALFSERNRTAIKSSNGTSKTFTMGAMVLWNGAVHEPGESLSIMTAPSNAQIEKGLVKHMKSFKNRANQRGFVLPGHINEQMEWVFDGPEGKVYLAYGRTPASGSEVSTFQGVRAESGKTTIFIDEAGGVSRGLWTAVEAIITGKQSRLIAIGNPDEIGTEWQAIFEERKYDNLYNRFTLSTFDLPPSTGEVVYPDDPEMEEQIQGALTQPEWAENKLLMWGAKDARYLSKVLGEFPKDGGSGFFPQAALNKAYAAEIEHVGGSSRVAGVDIARFGQDESVFVLNVGGNVRVLDTWGKSDTVTSARRIHKLAMDHGVQELRIDSTGVGGGVFDMLDSLDEFAEKGYLLIGVDNGSASPDHTKWTNMRAYAHDSLLEQMHSGWIDLDYDDAELREELQLISFQFSSRGGIQITAKDKMKTAMGGSPDRADAVILSAVDLSPWTGNPLNALEPGEKVVMDPDDFVAYSTGYGSWGVPL